MTNYVDKEVLHEEMRKHIDAVKAARDAGKPAPIPNDYIGRAILDIAENMAHLHNFRRYTWLDEMKLDGILAATKAINKYDPNRSTNPFGYFSQCIYWAFQCRIKKENKALEQKMEIMENVLDSFYDDGPDGVHHEIDKDAIIQMLKE